MGGWPLRIVGILILAALLGGDWYVARLERSLTFMPERFQGRADGPRPDRTIDVWPTTADGVKLHAWLLEAPMQPPRGAVLFLHGNAGNITHFAPDAEKLRDAGYEVLLVDYRGYGRSEGTSEDETTLNRDGAAGLRYLVEQRHFAPADVALVGYSLGSTVAAELSTVGPCKAVALIAPLASARAQATLSAPWAPSILLSRMRNKFDTVGKIGRANCPVMVVHGDADNVIDVSQGRAVFEAAREPKKLLILQGGRHWLPSSAGRVYLDEVAAFVGGTR